MATASDNNFEGGKLWYAGMFKPTGSGPAPKYMYSKPPTISGGNTQIVWESGGSERSSGASLDKVNGILAAFKESTGVEPGDPTKIGVQTTMAAAASPLSIPNATIPANQEMGSKGYVIPEVTVTDSIWKQWKWPAILVGGLIVVWFLFFRKRGRR